MPLAGVNQQPYPAWPSSPEGSRSTSTQPRDRVAVHCTREGAKLADGTVEFGELFSTPSAAYPPRAAGFSGQYAPTVVMSGGCLPISGSRMIGGRRADAE